MALNKNKTFSRKPYDKFLYRWSPQTDIHKVDLAKKALGPFCNAIPLSQGEDFFTTYMSNEITDGDGTIRRFAYVACDYVV